LAVTAVVFTTTVVAPDATTTLPAVADPHTAGEAIDEQFVAVDKVVNVPAAGEVPPIAPGDAKVAPPSVVAFIVPVPLVPSDPPVPIISTPVLVPDVTALKAVEPPEVTTVAS
jgi:hypothetical protein